jgi:hypothetical protein
LLHHTRRASESARRGHAEELQAELEHAAGELTEGNAVGRELFDHRLQDRSGFAYAEEVAAIPDECLLDLRNGGLKFLAAVRR